LEHQSALISISSTIEFSKMRNVRRFTLTDMLSLTAAIMLIVVCYAAARRVAPRTRPVGLWLTHAGEASVHISRRRNP
jgi:hypothetical protein